MSEAETLFIELSKHIPDAAPGKMFGAQCIKMPNGKAAAMFWRDHIVVKLGDEAQQEALSLDGVKVFEPMEGRAMNGWVQIPFDYRDQWKEFMEVSAKNVALLEKKEPAAKKGGKRAAK